MMTRYSLQALIDLSKHQVFGPRIKKVSFCPNRLNTHYARDVEDRLSAVKASDRIRGIKEAREHLTWYLTRLEEEVQLQESGDAMVLLKQAFVALQSHGNPIHLIATSEHHVQGLGAPIGVKEFEKGRPFRFASKQVLSWASLRAFACQDISRSLLVMLETALAANCDVNGLTLRAKYTQSAPVADEAPYMSDPVLKALSTLTKLELIIGEPALVGELDKTLETIIPVAKSVERFVLWLSRYQHIICPEPQLAEYVHHTLSMLNSSALSQIWLDSVIVYADHLVDMFRRHKDTLKDLTMSEVTLIGSWDDVVLYIRDELSLEKFVMVRSWNIDHGQYQMEIGEEESWLFGGVEFSGREAVKSGLTDVLSEMNKEITEPEYEADWKNDRLQKSIRDQTIRFTTMR